VIAPRHAGGLDIDPHRIGIVLCTYPSAVARDERMVKSKLSDWMYLGAMPEPETTHDSSDLEEMILPATANEAYDRILFRVTGEPVFRNVTSDEQSA